MTKKRSKCLFVVFAILLVVCLIACFVNFTYPLAVGGNYYSYSNFVENLRLGEDVSNGLRIVYNAEMIDEDDSTANYDALRQSTMRDLADIMHKEGYKDVSVSEYGADGIVLQVGNILTREDQDTILGLIGSPAAISFSIDGGDQFATGKHVKSVVAQQGSDANGNMIYGVVLEFLDEYKAEINAKVANKTIDIYLGSSLFADNISLDENGFIDGMIQLQSDSFKSMLDATTCANQIKAGMLDLTLTAIDSGEVTPSYGQGADILISIAILVLVLAGFVFLIVKYKHMGWLACFNLLFFIVLGLFFLQSIPLVHINFGGIVAMLICLIVAIDSLMSVFENAKRHYQEETKLYIAFKVAQKETLFKTLISNLMITVVGFICLFMPTMAVQSFGWVALVLSIVNLFTNLVLMRLFTKMYLALNNSDGKKCNFHKGGKNA
ncbi:MAG: hypothetical protein E7351_01975 [Clostridiales bacterium]|nr:hypothetical protein [Clostridiales bacterium]